MSERVPQEQGVDPAFVCPTHGEVPSSEVGYDSQPTYPAVHEIPGCGAFLSPGGVDEGGTASGLGNAGAAPQGSDVEIHPERLGAFLPDPYVCQRCHRLYPYLDLMGDPQCECGGEHFFYVPNGHAVSAAIWDALRRAGQLRPSPAGSGAEPEEGK